MNLSTNTYKHTQNTSKKLQKSTQQHTQKHTNTHTHMLVLHCLVSLPSGSWSTSLDEFLDHVLCLAIIVTRRRWRASSRAALLFR